MQVLKKEKKQPKHIKNKNNQNLISKLSSSILSETQNWGGADFRTDLFLAKLVSTEASTLLH